MRQIPVDVVGRPLADLLKAGDEVEEDIGIVDANGSVLGIVISPRDYEFFLRKVEEEEDRIDAETVNEFHKGKG